MQFVPVDVSRIGKIQGLAVEPKKDQEGVQTRNRDNVPQWRIQVLVTPPEGKVALEDVNVASHTEPVFAPMAELHFEDFVARYWEMTRSGGRTASGISLSASSFRVSKD